MRYMAPQEPQVKAFLFFVMMIASLTVANAEVYKWVDENGNVHFTDAPPPKQKTEEVKIQRAPTPSPQRAGSTVASQPDTEEETIEVSSDRDICSDAIRNLRRYAPIWERKIRAKMPQMSPEEREDAERSIAQLKNNMRRIKSGMSQCIKDMDNSAHRSKTECMANAPDDTMAMFCVM